MRFSAITIGSLLTSITANAMVMVSASVEKDTDGLVKRNAAYNSYGDTASADVAPVDAASAAISAPADPAVPISEPSAPDAVISPNEATRHRKHSQSTSGWGDNQAHTKAWEASQPSTAVEAESAQPAEPSAPTVNIDTIQASIPPENPETAPDCDSKTDTLPTAVDAEPIDSVPPSDTNHSGYMRSAEMDGDDEDDEDDDDEDDEDEDEDEDDNDDEDDGDDDEGDYNDEDDDENDDDDNGDDDDDEDDEGDYNDEDDDENDDDDNGDDDDDEDDEGDDNDEGDYNDSVKPTQAISPENSTETPEVPYKPAY
ncbi:hypothetical protein BSLG_009623 [Batrachochytrium salamandrivorans]|nr:hypothetical protein BSLG_009623 [Batrachochytrium salamandrivorans]